MKDTTPLTLRSMLYLVLIIALVIKHSEAMSRSVCHPKCQAKCKLLAQRNYSASYLNKRYRSCMADCLDDEDENEPDEDEKDEDEPDEDEDESGGWRPVAPTYNPYQRKTYPPYVPYQTLPPYRPYVPPYRPPYTYRPYVTASQRPPYQKVTYQPPYTYRPYVTASQRPPAQKVTYRPPNTYRPPQTYPPTINTFATRVTASRPSKFGCGLRRNFGSRIIGGTNTESCEFPWMVAINVDGNFCGGTIIDQQHVLTAAHCMKNLYTGEDQKPENVKVKYGSSQRSLMKTIGVIKVHINPKYGIFKRDFDVAVLKLERPLMFGPCVGPVCLPDAGERAEDKTECVAAGWGIMDPNLRDKSKPDTMRKVTLPLVSNAQCSKMWNNQYRKMMSDLKICAGVNGVGGKDACLGDSGGPLMCRTGNGPYTEYGIVSFGKDCALPDWPGIYTSVAHPEILQYITSSVNDV